MQPACSKSDRRVRAARSVGGIRYRRRAIWQARISAIEAGDFGARMATGSCGRSPSCCSRPSEPNAMAESWPYVVDCRPHTRAGWAGVTLAFLMNDSRKGRGRSTTSVPRASLALSPVWSNMASLIPVVTLFAIKYSDERPSSEIHESHESVTTQLVPKPSRRGSHAPGSCARQEHLRVEAEPGGGSLGPAGRSLAAQPDLARIARPRRSSHMGIAGREPGSGQQRLPAWSRSRNSWRQRALVGPMLPSGMPVSAAISW